MDLIMGMNSGSSFDGIDVILAETEMAEDGFPKAPRFICGGSYEWPKEVADIVQDAFVNKVDMVGLNRLNYLCGAVFAEKAAQFMKENNIDSRNIKVLGLDALKEELDNSVVANFATTASDGKVYQVEHYNLAIRFSILYRLNIEYTRFPIFPTPSVLF